MLFDFADLAAIDQYKLVVSTIVPRPIAWVSTRSLAGVVNAAPFSFFNAFGGSPPVLGLGLSLRENRQIKDTRANIEETAEFVVNLVSFANAPAMNVTAVEFVPEQDELDLARLTTAPCHHIAAPRIAESPVSFECRRHMTLDIGGGSLLILGRVLAVHVRDDAVLDATKRYIDTPKLDLIGRMHGGGWYARTTDRFRMDRPTANNWREGLAPANDG
jgi:flavin reductase (DIM6/NTAB) family NADH-FMN oxidoreductase RutF